MQRGCGKCWAVTLILTLILGTSGWFYLLRGNVDAHADGRTAILLSSDERNLVLGEMRGLLETVQTIVQASVKSDFDAVSTAATAAGMAAAEAESAALIGKLPLEFMRLGMGTHKAFDALAVTAGSTDDPLVVLEELGGIMDKCTGCHAGYRLGVEGANENKDD